MTPCSPASLIAVFPAVTFSAAFFEALSLPFGAPSAFFARLYRRPSRRPDGITVFTVCGPTSCQTCTFRTVARIMISAYFPIGSTNGKYFCIAFTP